MNTPGGVAKTITYHRLVDLSHVIDPHIPIWPGDPPVTFETVADLTEDGYRLRRFSMGEHSATHINAPSSFFRDGADIHSLPVADLVVPAVVVDVEHAAAGNPEYVLGVHDIAAWEECHGGIPPETMVLMHTGWHRRWHDRAAFLNPNHQGQLHFPAFGADAVRFLLDERKITGVGIDTHGVDPDEAFEVNRHMLARGRIVLENLANLDQLPPTGVTLVIGILRLRGGTGSPASVLAFVA
jgi:kynurenine formamidase